MIRAGQLNDSQQTRLRITCQYVDKLLGNIEDILHASASQSPFPRYLVDINPAQTRVIEDYIRRLRSQLVRTIAWQQMKPEPPDIPATRAIMAHLTFVDIAIEELGPHYMCGSGNVPEDAVGELNGVVQELRSLVNGMEHYLKQELSADLEKRLKHLEKTGVDVALLQLLEQVATRDGLVEFRSRIDILASRLEDDSFEVALFGRVSSGKSSLLNALLGTNVLPVGVNPITAVPTKLRYGASLKAAVTYGDGRNAVVSVGELSSLVTEQGNPGNLRNIARVIVEVPSPRLREGITLVDTPGLGSLAKRGAAETLAYLPSCDLALLLIDAGAALNEEDIGTLRLLYEAGIPTLVLLSKADLLSDGDLHRSTSYIVEQAKHDLGLNLVVHPVSALSNYSVMLDQFFERELLPRFEEARTLKEASVLRKIGTLREAVTSAIESTLNREKRIDSKQTIIRTDLESILRTATGTIGERKTVLSREFRGLGEKSPTVLDQVVARAALWVRTEDRISSLMLSEWIHDVVWQFSQSLVDQLRATGDHAISDLHKIAKELGRTDGPSQDEFETLLRGMPRFELAALPDEITVGRWKILGDRVVRARIKTSLEASTGPLLKQELQLYGLALSQWSEQLVHKLELLVNSYADAYRVQIHRISGTSDTAINVGQLQDDLDLLRNWDAARTGEFAENVHE